MLKSAFLLQEGKEYPQWRIVSADVEFGQKNAPPKPTIFLKNDELDLECRISKGGVEKLDELSKKHRKSTGSGFEPDVVYVFVKTSTKEAIVFLGDAKNYSTTDHDVAVRDKLLNVFAFSKALGIKLHGHGESGELIEHHKKNGIPIPSFMLFFRDMEKGEREFRSVMERFSIRCFDCSYNLPTQCEFCAEKCPGNVRKSFQNIIQMIHEKDFEWPLQFNIKTGDLRLKKH